VRRDPRSHPQRGVREPHLEGLRRLAWVLLVAVARGFKAAAPDLLNIVFMLVALAALEDRATGARQNWMLLHRGRAAGGGPDVGRVVVAYG
jgi:hypothetical protein